MELLFFKQEALDYFKANIESNIDLYQKNSNEWIYQQFENPFLPLKLEGVKEFEFYIDVNDPNRMDIENIKRLYSSLMNLSDSQACDERLWAGLTHSTFYKYVGQRWSGKREVNNMKKTNIIESRYFFGKHSPKLRNTLAKLWWIGKLTYDDENEGNPFHLTEVLGNHDTATRINDIFTSSFSRNKKLLRPFLKAINSYDSKGEIIDENYFRSAVQYMNIFGGIYLIDFMSETEIEALVVQRIEYYKTHGPDIIKQAKNKKVKFNDNLRIYSRNQKKKFQLKVEEKHIPYFLDKKIGDVVDYNNDKLEILLIF